MVADIRRVLAWTARNALKYGGDPEAIYLMGHGSGAHLALLTVVQEAVVRSRDTFWFSSYVKEAEQGREAKLKASSSPYEDHDEISNDNQSFADQSVNLNDTKNNIEVSAGIRRLEIWGGEDVEIPKVKGMILMSCISDVIKHTRNEFKNGLEQISPLRKALGPSHAQCLMASPSHVLFGAKQVSTSCFHGLYLTLTALFLQIINPKSLPPHILLIHGGQDQSVPIGELLLSED